MKQAFGTRIIAAMFAAYALAIAYPGPARAELADLADVPLANSPSDAVLPNLMYILDDSGSMQWDYMPDNIQRTTTGTNLNNCKTCTTSSCTNNARQCALGNQGSSDGNTADWGEPPYYSADFNQIYYNPDISYVPGTDYLGVSLGNASPTAAKKDGYLNPTTNDLTTTYPEIYYCVSSATATFTGTIAGTVLTVTAVATGTILDGMTLTAGSMSGGTKITALGTGTGGIGTYTINNSQTRASQSITGTWSTPTPAQLPNTSLCKRNGIDNIQASPNPNYFLYYSNNSTAGGTPLGGYPVQTGAASTSFNVQQVSNTGHPYYFRIAPAEHCKDRSLVECTASAVPTGLFTQPAPVRYCGTSANAAAAAPVSDAVGTTNPKCRQKFDVTNYKFPRYGRFTRVDIVPGTATYPKAASSRRTECVNAAYCTYAEELQNFANWYTYYRTRMALMKTATGRAFLPIDDRYRVGFITINPGSPVVRSTSPNYDGRYLPINKFDATQKSAWYTTLYKTGSNGSTHLREALSRVGRHYAGITTGINDGMTEDPVQYSCQQHFALLTTDGYYNDGVTDTYTTAGTQVGNQDNVPTTGLPVYVSRATGTLDGTGTTTVQTPATFIAQQICTANNNTSFPGGGSNTPCGCSGIQTRIKQRTQVGTNNQVFVNGVQTGTSTTITGTTFQDISGCTTPLIETSNTVVSETAQSVCTKNNNTSFPVANDTQNVQVACGCSTGNPAQSALKQRVEQYCVHVVKTDGVVTSSSFLNSSCTAATVPTRSFTTPLACSLAAKSIAISPNPTVSSGVPSVTNNGGTTLSIASFSPNPQTTITGPAGGSFSSAGTADTLADVAMYYYKNDLRTTGSVTITTNNVPTSGKEVAPHQHMTTFTLGLGLQGVMDYIADYESNPAGDFANIKAGTFGACPWMGAGEQCNWPIPTQGTPTTLDDLWHAAVNGRGVYYSASDPNSLADGLSGALSALHIQTAAASASATSSPNITQTDNFIFSSTFRTVKWDGEIVAQQVDTTTGNVLAPIIWSAQAQVDSTTGPSSDSRTIYLFDESAGNKRKSFTYANLNSGVVGTIAAEQPYFSGKCSALSQCALLTGPQQTIANDGTALVNYIRGQRENESAGIYRLRDHVLGDPINATPAFVRGSTFAFADSVTPDYNSFKAANVSRTPTLYIAANDGMLHAFNGNTGAETWAYIPRIVLPNLHKLATDNWDVQHKFSVDGSPQVMDVFDSTAPAAWKTVLVAGLNKGGRGFYAIDVTDPAAPKGMWEICSDATLCANVDADMGFSFGNPVITKRASDGRWVVVVTSGLNNASPGTGRGFLYTLDVFTGAVLSKVEAIDGGTTWGDTTTPSGFSKISGFANNFNADNTSLFIYGGDLFGNVWRFDMSIDPPVAQKLAQLTDASGNPQSITARPELGAITGNRVVFIGTGRYHGIDDLPDPSTLVPALPWAYQQTLYAFKDKGTNYGNNIRTVSPGLVQQTITDAAGIRTISANPMDWNTKDGWYVDFNPGSTSPGERVNLDPQLILGTLVVVTNVPKDSACSVGGDSFLYQFDYKSGSYVSTSAGGVIGVANTGQITVGVVVVRLPSGVIKAISTGATGTKTTSGVNIGSSGNPARRVSWRELFQ